MSILRRGGIACLPCGKKLLPGGIISLPYKGIYTLKKLLMVDITPLSTFASIKNSPVLS